MGAVRAVRWGLAFAMAVLMVAPGAAAAAPVGQVMEFSSGLATGSGITLPGIAAGPDGNVWFTDRDCISTGSCAIGRITPSGTIAEFTSGLNSGSGPVDITLGPDGNLWFTDYGSTPAIGRITPSGAITEFHTGLNPGSIPNAITTGPDGNLWFTDQGCYVSGTCAIGRITPTGTITEFTAGLNPGARTIDIASGPDDNLWFTDGGTTKAIGRITPAGTITEYSSGLLAGAAPGYITLGPDGNLWFDDQHNATLGWITTSGTISELPANTVPGDPLELATGPDGNLWFGIYNVAGAGIGRMTPSGSFTEFTAGLSGGSQPSYIAAGPDGNLWFTDDGSARAIGRIGAGAAIASAPPQLLGPGTAGAAETCQPAVWPTWAGVTPSASLSAFDGYGWLRDGIPIAGRSGQSYTPTAADAGHQIACTETVTYPFPLLITEPPLSSAAITVRAGGSGGGGPGGGGPGAPVLSHLRISPGAFSLAGRLVGGRCVKPTHANRKRRSCKRAIAFKVTYTLSAAAGLSVTVSLQLSGRTVGGKCVKGTRKNRKHRRCSYWSKLPGGLARSAPAGTSSFTFSGLPGHRLLAVGSYRITLSAAASGLTGAPQSVGFRISG